MDNMSPMEFHVLKKPLQNGKTKMNTSRLVLDCALPGIPGESRKQALVRAAENAGLSYARMRAFFYNLGNPPDEAREKLLEAARLRRAVWGDEAQEQLLDELKMQTKRIRENVAVLNRRATDHPPAPLEDFEAQRQGRFVFWLGREASNLDTGE